MKRLLAVFLIMAAAPAFAQSRDDVRIFVPPVVGTPAQAAFFRENFIMETTAAGYTVTQDAREADYNLRLVVRPNMITYDDGTQAPAPADEHQFILTITLIRNSDNAEIVSLAYTFTELEEMFHHNLALLYQTMANVPLSKESGEAGTSTVIYREREGGYLWRNKWLYARLSVDYLISSYQLLLDPPALMTTETPPKYQQLDHKVIPFLGTTVGLEFQYLYWMSTEFTMNLSFGDPNNNYSFIPAVEIQQKFPIKPFLHLMIEPYLVVSFPVNTSPTSERSGFPKWGFGGGLQLGVRGGDMGAFFIDANYAYFPGDVVMKNHHTNFPQPKEIPYRRFVVGFGLGYKIGFFDRPTRTPPAAASATAQ